MSGALTRAWTISKATISVVFTGSGKSTYDGLPHGVTATVSGIVGVETVKFDIIQNTYTFSGFTSNINVGNGEYLFTRTNYGTSTISIASSFWTWDTRELTER